MDDHEKQKGMSSFVNYFKSIDDENCFVQTNKTTTQKICIAETHNLWMLSSFVEIYIGAKNDRWLMTWSST